MSFTNDVLGSYVNCLAKKHNKIWLEYTSKPAESCEKKCEARIIDSTDPEDILGSLAPSYKKNPSFKYSGINLEKKEELCPETLIISQWISECKEMKQKRKLNYFHKTKMMAQLESFKIVPGSFSKDFETTAVQKEYKRSYANCLDEERNKILLKYTSKPAESCEKTCEAKIIDSTHPENTPLIYEWISKCEEMIKTGELTFLEMEKKCTTMEAQLDESSQVDQELSLKSVENDDEYFDDNSLFKTLFKTLLKYRSKPAENLKRKREAEDLDATDPEDILGSLAPSYEKNTSSEHSGINLEMEKELCPEDTPLIYEWISKCEEMIKTGELTFLEMEKKCTTMEAQLDESSQVDQELSSESVEKKKRRLYTQLKSS